MPGRIAAMDAAATEMSRLNAKMVEAGATPNHEPFLYVDLVEWEPHWCKGKSEAHELKEEDLQQQEGYQQSKGFQALARMLGARPLKKHRQTLRNGRPHSKNGQFLQPPVASFVW